MDDDLPDIDEKAIRHVSRIDRCIEKMRRNDQGAFLAITNAIEYHLEIFPRDAETVRYLAHALDAFVRSRQIDAEAVGFEKQLRSLMEYA